MHKFLAITIIAASLNAFTQAAQAQIYTSETVILNDRMVTIQYGSGYQNYVPDYSLPGNIQAVPYVTPQYVVPAYVSPPGATYNNQPAYINPNTIPYNYNCPTCVPSRYVNSFSSQSVYVSPRYHAPTYNYGSYVRNFNYPSAQRFNRNQAGITIRIR